MFVDCSGLESYTDINTSFGKLVNTYYCFAACDCVDEQLGILKSLVPAYYEVAALTNTDFVSGRAGGITQKLLAMAMTLRQIADCLALIERCDSMVPVEVANPTSFKGSVMTLPLSRAYARLLDDWSYYMRRQQQQQRQPMAGRTGWVDRLQHRLPWQRSRTVVIPMLYIGGTAESARDLGSVLRDCEVRHTGETPLQLLWTSSPELAYATPQAYVGNSSMHDWSRYEFDFSNATEDDSLPGGRERKCVVQLEALLGALATTDPLFQW
ncbi:hypothetical protein GRS66_008676 [Saccharomyces pastorianus]|nr:hypothetical protein GRS66_008676 [Saccharomyces pastorianus]